MRVDVHLMACRDIYCEETSPFKYLKFFSQNAEPLRPFLQFWPKSGVYLIFYNICPYTPFKGKWGSGSISWHVETFVVRKPAYLKYLKFFSQNAEPLRPLPYRPKSGVYLNFYNICPYNPFKGRWGSRIHLIACRDICCGESSPFKYLKFFSQNAEPLRPLSISGPKVVSILFFAIFAPTPLSKANEGRRPSRGM